VFEPRVGEDVAAGRHEGAEQHVLGCAVLVDGQDVLKDVIAQISSSKRREAAAGGVALVAEHQRAPLRVAHRGLPLSVSRSL
jgi:hypothetical protein